MQKARLTKRVRQTYPSRNSRSLVAKSGIVHLVKDGGWTEEGDGLSILVWLGLEVSFGGEDGSCWEKTDQPVKRVDLARMYPGNMQGARMLVTHSDPRASS
jgi:hypothetical protein